MNMPAKKSAHRYIPARKIFVHSADTVGVQVSKT
jgi:hypothetical protein